MTLPVALQAYLAAFNYMIEVATFRSQWLPHPAGGLSHIPAVYRGDCPPV